jgi:hypothetical protein
MLAPLVCLTPWRMGGAFHCLMRAARECREPWIVRVDLPSTETFGQHLTCGYGNARGVN